MNTKHATRLDELNTNLRSVRRYRQVRTRLDVAKLAHLEQDGCAVADLFASYDAAHAGRLDARTLMTAMAKGYFDSPAPSSPKARRRISIAATRVA